MPRQKNSGVTVVMFLVLAGAGWAAYKYLYVERALASNHVETPLAGKEAEVRTAIEDAMRDDPCFTALTNLQWRANEFRWRVDVNVPDSCRDQAKSLARRIAELVKAATDGGDANVFCYAVGQEVARYVP